MSSDIKAKVERSSLGTKQAKAARRTVTYAAASKLVARAQSGRFEVKRSK